MRSKPLTSRERLERAYHHRPMDRPGVYVRTGYPSGDPTYEPLKAYMTARTELKRGWPSSQVETPRPVETRVERHSDDWERLVTVVHAPAGDLTKTHLRSLRGLPGMEETHLLQDRSDAETLLSLSPPQLRGEVSSFFQAVAEIGDRGIVEVSLGYNPAGVAAELFGSEAFALMTVSDRDVLHELCERQTRVLLGRIEYLLARGVGPFFSMAGEEFLVPPLHGPADFHDFNVRYDRRIIDRIHQAGGRVHVHSHGRIRKVLDGFLEAGVDVLHPFEPPPMGDITAAEAKAVVGGRMTIEGNIQIAMMYEGTPDQIRDWTASLIRDAFSDGQGLIVCPAASPYQRGKGGQCFEQFRAMVETVLAWKA